MLSSVVAFLCLFSGVFGNEFTHHAVLDSNDKFHLFWYFDNTSITFEAQVAAHGYVAIGISPNGGMAPADVAVGWVKDGKATLSDRHTTSKSTPVVDPSQDWHLLSGSENSTHTILRFRRALDTCDDKDEKITSNTVRMIYAWSDADPTGEDPFYHRTNRGTRSLLLLAKLQKSRGLPDDVRTLDLLNQKVKVPSDPTTYWCQAFKVPKLKQKNHIIKIEPVIQRGNEGVVHHILVFNCFGKFPDYYHGKGTNCEGPDMPRSLRQCRIVTAAWAVGGGTFDFPEHAGLPIGTADDPSFVVMETHYDNPQRKSGIVDSSGLRFYMTPTLRKHDAAILELGLDVGPSHVIPPYMSNFTTPSYCPTECLTEALSGETKSINAFAAVLHEHLIGVGARTRVIRNGKEVARLGEDNHYDFNFQEIRYLEKEVTLLPGDLLQTECVYNSKKRKSITLGGLASQDEMCLNFVMYYPRIDFGRCVSRYAYDRFPANYPNDPKGVLLSKPESNELRQMFQRAVNNFSYYSQCRTIKNKQLKAERTGKRRPLPISSFLKEPASVCIGVDKIVG